MTEPAAPRTFTQDELNAVAARERTSAAAAAKTARDAELAEQFGVPVDQVAGLIKAAQDAENANLDEAQKAKKAADDARTAADGEKAAAALDRHSARIERKLIRAGIPEEKLDYATRLVTVDQAADDDALKAAIDKLKEDLPELFGAAKEAPPRPYGVPDPGRGPANRTPPGTPGERDPRVAARLARDGVKQAS